MSPEEIDDQTFTLVRRGYDPDEVKAYFARLLSAQSGSSDFAHVGEEIAQVLQTANDTAKSMRYKASADAASLTAEATQLRDDLQASRDAIEAEKVDVLADAASYSATTRSAAEEFALGVRTKADEYANATRSAADNYTDDTRTAADDEAKAIRANAEDDVADRTRAVLAESQARLDDLLRTETSVRERIQAAAAELGKLAAEVSNNAQLDITDAAQAPVVATPEPQPPARAAWTAVGEALADHSTVPTL